MRQATSDITAYVNVTPVTPSLTQNGPKKSGTGVTFTASGGTAYDWAGAFSGSGASKTSSTATGSYTARVRNVVTTNSKTCYSAYTSNVTGVVEKGVPTIPGVTWTNTQVLASQYTWNQAQSACPSGWRLPTRDEFQKMVDAGSTWRVANSGYGNTEAGTFFGTNSESCTLANGNCIFLPARGHNGNDIGTYGGCWSSTRNYSNYRYGLFFTPHYSSVSYDYDYDGCSVLCVQ